MTEKVGQKQQEEIPISGSRNRTPGTSLLILTCKRRVESSQNGNGPNKTPQGRNNDENVRHNGNSTVGLDGGHARNQINRCKGDPRPHAIGVATGQGKKQQGKDHRHGIARHKGKDEPNGRHDDREDEGGFDEGLGDAHHDLETSGREEETDNGGDNCCIVVALEVFLKGIVFVAQGIASVGSGHRDNGDDIDVKERGKHGILALGLFGVFLHVGSVGVVGLCLWVAHGSPLNDDWL